MRHLRSSILRLSILTLLIASTFAMSAPASAGTVTVTGPFCSGEGGTLLSSSLSWTTSASCSLKYHGCSFYIGETPYVCANNGWSYNTTKSQPLAGPATYATGVHRLCNSDQSICGNWAYSTAP